MYYFRKKVNLSMKTEDRYLHIHKECSLINTTLNGVATFFWPKGSILPSELEYGFHRVKKWLGDLRRKFISVHIKMTNTYHLTVTKFVGRLNIFIYFRNQKSVQRNCGKSVSNLAGHYRVGISYSSEFRFDFWVAFMYSLFSAWFIVFGCKFFVFLKWG